MRVRSTLLLTLALAGCYPPPPPAVIITDRVLEAHERRLYLQYRDSAEQRNLERERSGLAPQPILGFAEWRSGH